MLIQPYHHQRQRPAAAEFAGDAPAVTRSRPVQLPSAFTLLELLVVLLVLACGAALCVRALANTLPQYALYLKLSRVPKPFKIWVFLDEHPDSINDGYFVNNPTSTSWQDIPAAYHDGGCTFSFADGHAEIRRWTRSTSQYGVRYYYPTTRPFDPAGKLDFACYLERTGYRNRTTGETLFGY